MIFLRKNVAKFPTLCHLSSGHDILTTITPNHARLKPIETRHTKVSRDIRFEEIRAKKGLQIAAQK